MPIKVEDLKRGQRIRVTSKNALAGWDIDTSLPGEVVTSDAVLDISGKYYCVTLSFRNKANTANVYTHHTVVPGVIFDWIESWPEAEIASKSVAKPAVTEHDCAVCKRKNYSDAKFCWWCGTENPTCKFINYKTSFGGTNKFS